MEYMMCYTVELIRGKGLCTIRQCLGRVIMDLDNQAVCASGHCGHGERLNQPCNARGVAGVYHHREMGQLFENRIAEMSRVLRV